MSTDLGNSLVLKVILNQFQIRKTWQFDVISRLTFHVFAELFCLWKIDNGLKSTFEPKFLHIEPLPWLLKRVPVGILGILGQPIL